MSNPFEDADGSYLVLVNDERQYCIWPAFSETPGGWRIDAGPDGRAECLARIEQVWTDLRPASLVEPAV